jgi:hypothetical protein
MGEMNSTIKQIQHELGDDLIKDSKKNGKEKKVIKSSMPPAIVKKKKVEIVETPKKVNDFVLLMADKMETADERKHRKQQ